MLKQGKIIGKDTLNTFYLRLYGVGHMVKDHSDSERGNPLPPHVLLFPISSKVFFISKEGNVLFNDTLNTFYLRLYGVGHMVNDHSETRCRHMGYSFQLAASHRGDSTYHSLCYTSCGALAGMTNSLMGPPHE